MNADTGYARTTTGLSYAHEISAANRRVSVPIKNVMGSAMIERNITVPALRENEFPAEAAGARPESEALLSRCAVGGDYRKQHVTRYQFPIWRH